MTHPSEQAMRHAIALARQNIEDGGRPYGAVLMRGSEVLSTGVNEIHRTGDPTAHAELLALRDAGKKAKNPDLRGTVMYASGHPCPMCMAAMHLAGVGHVYFAYSNEDGEKYGLSSAHVYREMRKPPQEQSLPLEAYRPAIDEDLYAIWARRAIT